MNGTTSTAPILACSPECFDISIRSSAMRVPLIAASRTDSGGPTIVTTVRLKSAPISTSSSVIPSTATMASVIARIIDSSRPSEKFGTHSTSVGMNQGLCHPSMSVRISGTDFLEHLHEWN